MLQFLVLCIMSCDMLQETKSKISVLRPLLIVLVVSAHVPWTLYNPVGKDVDFTFWNFLRLALTAVMSPIGMPLLSVISGFLVVLSFEKYGLLTLLKKKTSRILVPMVVWNFAFATLIYWAQSHAWESRPDLPLFNGGLGAWLNALLAIDTVPANGPLYFLRELFLCFCLTPILVFLAKYRPLSYVLMIASVVIIIADIQLPFIFRFDIYAWFFFGVFSFIHGLDKCTLDARLSAPILIGGLMVFITVALSYFVTKALFNYLVSTVTIIGPFYFWLLSEKIHKSSVGLALKKCSKYSFTIFLSHAYVISCCWQIWSINVGRSPFDNFVVFGIFCTTSVFVIAPVFYHSFYWWLRYAGFLAEKKTHNKNQYGDFQTNSNLPNTQVLTPLQQA